MDTRANTQSLLIELQSIVERLDTARLFPHAQPVEVELGCGDGSFILEYARLNPGKNFLAVERLLGRLRKVDRKGRRAGLANLRALRIESAYFLEYLLPEKSAAAIHLYFPDPWPKRKQKKNRLVNARFAEIARQALAPGGVVYMRTDHAEYFSQMTEVFDADKNFEEIATPPELAALHTDFERQFHARGIKTLRSARRLLPGK